MTINSITWVATWCFAIPVSCILTSPWAGSMSGVSRVAGEGSHSTNWVDSIVASSAVRYSAIWQGEPYTLYCRKSFNTHFLTISIKGDTGWNFVLIAFLYTY